MAMLSKTLSTIMKRKDIYKLLGKDMVNGVEKKDKR